MIDWPSNPVVGQTFNSATGPIYTWDGVAWTLTGNTMPQQAWEQIAKVDIVNSYCVVPNLSPFRRLRFSGSATVPVVTGMGLQVSTDNGATWIQGASDYQTLGTYVTYTAIVQRQLLDSVAWFTNYNVAAGSIQTFSGNLENFNNGLLTEGFNNSASLSDAPRVMVWDSIAIAVTAVAPFNAIQFLVWDTTFSGNILIEGVRG